MATPAPFTVYMTGTKGRSLSRRYWYRIHAARSLVVCVPPGYHPLSLALSMASAENFPSFLVCSAWLPPTQSALQCQTHVSPRFAAMSCHLQRDGCYGGEAQAK